MWKQTNVQMNYWYYKYQGMFKIKMIHGSSYPMLHHVTTCMITEICTLFNLMNSTINVLKQFGHFNALVVSQYVNILKSASPVEYFAVKVLSSALILIHPFHHMAILFFVQYDYHQLQKICSWSAFFGYIEYVYIHKIYFMSWYTSNKTHTHQTK